MSELKPEEIAKRIVERLDTDISDRRGLKWEWDKIDSEVMDNELKPTWERIICEEVAKAQLAKDTEVCPECMGKKTMKYGGRIPHFCATCHGSGRVAKRLDKVNKCPHCGKEL